MKFSKYFMLAGAAAMLTACSSEEPLVGPDNSGNDPLEDGCYAYFDIAMASGAATRAADFAGGTAEEYNVKNGKILVFGLPKGVDDSTVAGRVQAKFIVDAEFNFTNTPSTDRELDASNSKVLASFKKGTFSSDQYGTFYGVVVLNYSSDWIPTAGQTFQEWAENQTLNGDLCDSKGNMVMTNAPKYVAGNPTVLSVINTDNVKDTQTELEQLGENARAASFTVQRVAAKVSFANAAAGGKTEFTVADGEYQNGKAEIIGWAMDLTRNTAFPVQNVWGENVAKFFKTDAASWFYSTGTYPRCYWGDSKFYDKQMTVAECTKNFNFLGTIPAASALSMNESEYIRPNTASYTLLNKGQTTRMVIKAKFTPDGVTAGSTLIKFKNVTTLFTEATLKDKVVAVVKKLLNQDVTAEDVTVNVPSAGWKKFSDVVPAIAGVDAEKLPVIAEGMGIYDQTKAEVAVYLNGECYYNVYIRHFADEQEDAGIKVKPGISTSIYNEDHTGRYAIVRNNWYDVTVKSISGPGMPSNPEPDPNKPVDEIEDDSNRYMNVDVNILNWAKRSQNVDL